MAIFARGNLFLVDSDKLQCLNLSIISDLDCNKSYPCLITASMFCAGYLEGGKGVCKGDSGGPLVSNGELQGLAFYPDQRFFWVNTTAEDESSEQSILSERVIHHPQFNYLTTDNDIMLIKLSKPATLSEYVKTLDLPKSCAPPDTMCRVSGWGITMNNMVDSDKLQCLNLSIISDLDCNKSYPCLITASMFCAGYLEGGKGVCKGDSGGPLVSNGELQGIQRVAVMLRKISLVSLPSYRNCLDK
ncbi:trypsin-1 isoform X5 [Labeo rohita]|uniref:Trypsin-1 isoform X5 n=1 Tax=Labeo rohita TaxID=84645 RepID=A0A498M664_LABRO|nr:trypsin-1 isoform X5 [Labeo rohita]